MTFAKALIASPRSLSLADQGVVSAANFFTLVYVGRQIDNEQYGFFSLAILGVLFLANLQRALITRPMDLLGATESHAELQRRLRALFGVLLLAAPIAVALLGFFAFQFFPQVVLFASCAAYLLCFALQEMMRRYWYAVGHVGNALRSDLISYGGQAVGLVAIDLLWGINACNAFLVMAGTSLAAFLVDLPVTRSSAGSVPRPKADVLRQHWGISKWLVLTVFAVWGAGQIYPVLVASLGPVSVATFAACGNILRGVSLLVQTVDNYLPSRAAALLHQKGSAELRRHLRQTMSRCLLGGIVVVTLIYLVANPIMKLVYGGSYDDAGVVLRLMLPGALFGFLGAVLGAYSLAMSDSRASFVANMAATVCTFSIGLWLILHLGISGAAIASSLTAATSMLVQGGMVMLRLRNAGRPIPAP